MDFQSNFRNKVSKTTAESDQCHFNESSAGHLTVQTTSPFRMKTRDSEFLADQKIKKKRKNDQSTNFHMVSKKLPSEACSSTTSKLLVKQIIKDNNLDGDRLNVDDVRADESLPRGPKKCNYGQHFYINNVQFNRSASNFHCKSSSMDLGPHPREDSIAPGAITKGSSGEHLVRMRNSYSNNLYNNNIQENNSTQKTTYCEPLDIEFVNRTLEKHARLQKLVKKLIDARKKEKETEAWKNYINGLKNKHSFYNNKKHPFNHCDGTSRCECIKNGSEFHVSNTYNDLLQDLYAVCDDTQSKFNYESVSQIDQSVYCEIKSDCYPMSSQGRLLMVNKERKRSSFMEEWQHRPAYRPNYAQTIIVDRDYTSKRRCEKMYPTPTKTKQIPHESKRTACVSCNFYDDFVCKTLTTQTSNEMIHRSNRNIYTETKADENNDRTTFKDQYERVSQNVERLKKKIQETAKFDGRGALANIENKLDSLISSLNSFIGEVISKTNNKQSIDWSSMSMKTNKSNHKNINMSRSDTFGLAKTEKLICGLLTQNSTKAIPIRYNNINRNKCTNIDQILSEELDNSKKAKEDIESILSGNILHPCEVHTSLDIPTKERSTEVTDSLSKAVFLQDKAVKNTGIDAPRWDKKMTVAVNTDPLGLLALLRVSTETLKQFLSYMPNIRMPYHSYLSMIQLPQARIHSDFVCNICGAAFERPSQLSDHIQSHDLGKTRDCCVCRHVLDIECRRPPGLYRCRYCGQRFTRAYCCELHQKSCAKRLGLEHDVRSSLMILR